MANIAVAQKLGNTEQVFPEQLWGADFERGFISGTPHGGRWSDAPVSSISEAQVEIEKRVEQGGDVYMSCATFGNLDGRKAANAKEMRAFWFDLDCGAEKAGKGAGYRTKNEAAAKLTGFCQKISVPAPTAVIDSGNGLHAYWFLDTPVSAERWKPAADKLKVLTRNHGLLADDACTADAARVLRVPGTFNYKDPANLKTVMIKRNAPPVNADVFIAAIEKAHSAIVQAKFAAIPAFMTAGGNLDAIVTPETPGALHRLQDALASIPADCDRETWRQVVWAVQAHAWPCCEDMAREWSMKSAEKYDEADFNSLVASFNSHGGTGAGTLYHLAKLHGCGAKAN